MQISISPNENAPAVRAARAWMQKPHVNKENAMTYVKALYAKSQAKAILTARHNADFQRFLRIAMGVSV